MRRGVELSSPDGDRWLVRRRWMDRPAPKLWRRKRDDDAADGGRDALSSVDLDLDDDLAGAVLVVAGAVLLAAVVLVLLPLLGIALELVALFALLSSGIVGRVLLRRPWTIEAINLDRPERSAAFAVKGWRRSRRAIAELSEALPATGLPDRLSTGIRARELIAGAQADPGLSSELADAFPDSTDQL